MIFPARFERFVQRTDSCWRWTGCVVAGAKQSAAEGYGQFQFQNRRQRAHRVAWQLAHGPIPAGLFVLHRCDNRRCVRPDHLSLGTHAENMRDMREKRRQANGERMNHARLTALAVVEIRRLYAAGIHTQRAIGLMFGVAQSTISDAIRGIDWAHIEVAS